ncbi:hypothetical protein VTH06DRAFT_2985 [Thermothelomyces fergusii]
MTLQEQDRGHARSSTPTSAAAAAAAITISAANPSPAAGMPSPPKLRLKIQDLNHPGAAKFLGAVNAATVLSTAVNNVLRLLYKSPSDRDTTVPPTRSVTLILRTWAEWHTQQGDHKEVHFSLAYIDSVAGPAGRLADEIAGVLTHELVHCYQWDGRGTCPGGLIEGVADWVRLSCGLSPPHWKKETTGADRICMHIHTAYFLQYLEERFGEGTIRRLNDELRHEKYAGETFWLGLFGQSVEVLYSDYVKSQQSGAEDGE